MTTRRCVRVQREVSSGVRDVKKGSEGRGGGQFQGLARGRGKDPVLINFFFQMEMLLE